LNVTVTGYCATPELALATFETAVTFPVVVAPVADRLDELEFPPPASPRRPGTTPKPPPKGLELLAVVTVSVAL
jgi:hypothetical protein